MLFAHIHYITVVTIKMFYKQLRLPWYSQYPKRREHHENHRNIQHQKLQISDVSYQLVTLCKV